MACTLNLKTTQRYRICLTRQLVCVRSDFCHKNTVLSLVSCLSAALSWVCFAIFFFYFSNPFQNVASSVFIFFQVPLSENGVVKWEIVVPPAVVKYTYKPRSTGPPCPCRTLDCLLNPPAHSVMSNQPLCHMLASEQDTVKNRLGLDVINDHVCCEHIIIPCSFISSSVL